MRGRNPSAVQVRDRLADGQPRPLWLRDRDRRKALNPGGMGAVAPMLETPPSLFPFQSRHAFWPEDLETVECLAPALD